MLHYYSFVIKKERGGLPYFETLDIKLPALDPKIAVTLYWFNSMYLHRRDDWVRNKHIFRMPARSQVADAIYQIIEYDKVLRPAYGKTLVQYKQMQIISQPRILELFKEYYTDSRHTKPICPHCAVPVSLAAPVMRSRKRS